VVLVLWYTHQARCIRQPLEGGMGKQLRADALSRHLRLVAEPEPIDSPLVRRQDWVNGLVTGVYVSAIIFASVFAIGWWIR
jgi:hypothetical protein